MLGNEKIYRKCTNCDGDGFITEQYFREEPTISQCEKCEQTGFEEIKPEKILRHIKDQEHEIDKLKKDNKELKEFKNGLWSKWCNMSIEEFDNYLHKN